MKTIILGGFGFWGKPMALRLSRTGHRLATVNNRSHWRIKDAFINRFDNDGNCVPDAPLADTAGLVERFKGRFDPAGAPARSLSTRDSRPGVARHEMLQENAR